MTVKPRLHDTAGCIVYTAGYQTGCTIRFDNPLNEQWLFVQHGCQTSLTTSLTTGWMFVYTIHPGCTTGLTTGCIVYTGYNSDVHSVLLASTITYIVAVHLLHYKRHCIFYENVSDATSSKVLEKHWWKTMKFAITVFPDNIFPLTFSRLVANFLAFPGFSDKWSPCIILVQMYP